FAKRGGVAQGIWLALTFNPLPSARSYWDNYGVDMTDISTLELLSKRRTVTTAFLDDPGPTDEQLRDLITIAMRVPDHGKLAPWRFVALDRGVRQALAPELRKLREIDEPDLPEASRDKVDMIFVQAPLCLVVVSTAKNHVKIPIWEQELSVGASTMNLMVAAHAMGFGAQWLTGWATYNADAKALLGVSEDEKIAGFIHIGTPTVPPTERPRPAVDDHLQFLTL
ncbi:MAG: nitroreductase, partial [Devosiaceae bacterium]